MTASAIYKDNKVYVGDVSGAMSCLDIQNGRKLWDFHAKEAIYGTAAIKNNYLVFTSADSNIYCIESETGKNIWKKPYNHC